MTAPKISLCIPTMNRYKDYLSKFVPKFLEYDIFDEIIIIDENGLDKYQLDQQFAGNAKVKVYTNDVRLGAFRNKLKCIEKASNEWVFLLDSDNFIGPDFAKKLREFVEQTPLNPKAIYCPEMALVNWKPQAIGTQTRFLGKRLDKDAIKQLCLANFSQMEFFLNEGNYLLNRGVLDYDYDYWKELIDVCKCYDTIFFTFLMTYTNGMHLEIIPGLRYNYAAHQDSYYILNNSLKEVQDFYKHLLFLMANEDALRKTE
jgi:glycosyltransferase involved in cell wall biosynthesis